MAIANISGNLKGSLHQWDVNYAAGTRVIWMYLPPSYERTKERYPVIYVHDGKDLFDPEKNDALVKLEAFFEQGMMQEIILAGIAAGERNDEMTPWSSDFHRDLYGHFGGKGDAYLHFITGELKPALDHRYRTRPEAENTGMIGASLGGLISLFAAIRYPDIFEKAGGISSSAWFEGFYDFVQKNPVHADLKFYLDVGDSEGRDMQPANEELYKIFLQAGYDKENLLFRLVPKGEHDFGDFAARFPDALCWLMRKDRDE
jgi:predicted alpha/beta superfamily hydrolase